MMSMLAGERVWWLLVQSLAVPGLHRGCDLHEQQSLNRIQTVATLHLRNRAVHEHAPTAGYRAAQIITSSCMRVFS